jgi:RNA-binding protein YhbY
MPATTRDSLKQEYHEKIEELVTFVTENNMTQNAARDLKKQLDEEYILKGRALKATLLAARTLHRQVCHTHFHEGGSECPNLNMCLNTHATNCQM